MKNIIIENVRELKEIYKELNDKLENIKEVTNDLSFTDLKLHNASNHIYRLVELGLLTSNQAEQVFSTLCDNELEYFEEWETDNLRYVSREYIGTTSSFYYTSNCSGVIVNSYDINTLLKGNNIELIEYMYDLPHSIYNCLIKESEDTIDKLIEEIKNKYTTVTKEHVYKFFEESNSLLQSMALDLNLIEEIVQECELVYEYLNDFKDKSNEIELVNQYLLEEVGEVYYLND